MDIALLGGMGAGLRIGKMVIKRGDTYLPTGISGFSGFPIFVEDPFVRLNIGARVLFDQRYGFELLTNLPLNASVMQETQRVKVSMAQAYYFTLNFVMEL